MIDTLLGHECALKRAHPWNINSFFVSNKVIHSRWILIKGKITENKFESCIRVIYNSNDNREQGVVYEELNNHLSTS